MANDHILREIEDIREKIELKGEELSPELLHSMLDLLIRLEGEVGRCHLIKENNNEVESKPEPKAREWWYCSLRQGCFGKSTVLIRSTDKIWNLPDEALGVVWKQEDVTPLYKMVREE